MRASESLRLRGCRCEAGRLLVASLIQGVGFCNFGIRICLAWEDCIAAGRCGLMEVSADAKIHPPTPARGWTRFHFESTLLCWDIGDALYVLFKVAEVVETG